MIDIVTDRANWSLQVSS